MTGLQAFDRFGAIGGIIANLSSVVALAAGGIAVNIAIARHYGIDGLGTFSQLLALFLIGGQICAGGFAFSTLYHFSRTGRNDRDSASFLLAMLVPVLAIGITIVIIALILEHAYGRGSDWPFMAALPMTAFAVMFFAVNKVGVMALNGMGYLKSLALVQGARMPLMLVALLCAIELGFGIDSIGTLFIVSEITLSAVILILLARFSVELRINFAQARKYLRQEGGRGWRGLAIGLLADINTKVDILVLSFLAPSAVVGIYALGALFADGLRMVLAALQNVINPELARLAADHNQSEIDRLYRTLAIFARLLMAVGVVVGALVTVYIVPHLINADDSIQSALIFMVMGIGTLLAAPAVVLNQVFSQSGHPLAQTGFFAALATINVVLNLALVPWLGALGAAIATALAEVAQLTLLSWLFTRVTGLTLPRVLGQPPLRSDA